MSKGCDGLHFDGVSLVERVVEDTWSINDLPAGIFVVGVTNEEVLCRESIGLNINISIRDIVNEARLSDIGEACNNQCASIGVDCW